MVQCHSTWRLVLSDHGERWVADNSLQIIMSVLKEMAVENKMGSGLKYRTFIDRVQSECNFIGTQKGPMTMRFQLLESFMDTGKLGLKLNTKVKDDLFTTKPGQLTIVDLTDPFIDSSGACVLFDIALALFLDSNKGIGKVVALDEAHKVCWSCSWH